MQTNIWIGDMNGLVHADPNDISNVAADDFEEVRHDVDCDPVAQCLDSLTLRHEGLDVGVLVPKKSGTLAHSQEFAML